MVIRLVLLLGLSLALAAEATELEDGTLLFGEHNPMPAAVMALQDCGANERTYAKRRRFADGFIFAVKCASNHENWVETLIFSEHEDRRRLGALVPGAAQAWRAEGHAGEYQLVSRQG